MRKTLFYTHYRAKNAWGELHFMKSGSLWDKNQGSLNGIRRQKGSAKNQAHVPDYIKHYKSNQRGLFSNIQVK